MNENVIEFVRQDEFAYIRADIENKSWKIHNTTDSPSFEQMKTEDEIAAIENEQLLTDTEINSMELEQSLTDLEITVDTIINE